MNVKEIGLIKKKYCEDNQIEYRKSKILFEPVRKSAAGNTVFLVTKEDRSSFHYELIKQDLSPLSTLKSLSIPKQYRNDFDVTHNKALISEWINRKTGLGLVEEDIANISATKTHINITIALDSMRFKSDFRLIRL